MLAQLRENPARCGDRRRGQAGIMGCMATGAVTVLNPGLDRFGMADEMKETRW